MGQAFEQVSKVRWCYACCTFILPFLIVTASYVSQAGELAVMPRIAVNEIISDNIDLVSEGKEKEYVTQLIPGITINRKGGKSVFNVDYSMENLFYAKKTGRNTSYNRLQANATVEVEKDRFLLDANVRNRQQLINAEEKLILDNINSADRSDIFSYEFGGRLSNHHGAYAYSMLDFSFGKVNYSNTNQFTDSDITRLALGVESGPRFNALQWGANYDLRQTRRRVGDKTKLESIEGRVEGRTFYRLNLLVKGGYINDDLQSLRAIDSGYFLGVGLIWRPSPKLSIDGTYGTNNKDINVEYNPTRRTTLRLNYLDRDVGTNPGSRWSGLYRHAVRRYSWDVSYSEDTTNLQLLELAGGTPPPLLDIGGTQVNPYALIFKATGEDFVRKKLRFNFTIKRAKSTLQLNASGEKRDFQGNAKQDKFYGGGITWNWKLTARSEAVISGGVLNRHFGTEGVDDTYWYSGESITRQFRPHINGYIRHRYIELNVNEGDGPDYNENRLVIGFEAQF